MCRNSGRPASQRRALDGDVSRYVNFSKAKISLFRASIFADPMGIRMFKGRVRPAQAGTGRATGDHKNFFGYVQTFAHSMPIRDIGAKRFPQRRWIPARPGGGSTRSAVNEAGPTVLGRFPQKSLRAKQLFQNRRVQTGSPTEPHTLDCTTHFARLTSFENPP
jgi:hypothetical protein